MTNSALRSLLFIIKKMRLSAFSGSQKSLSAIFLILLFYSSICLILYVGLSLRPKKLKEFLMLKNAEHFLHTKTKFLLCLKIQVFY